MAKKYNINDIEGTSFTYQLYANMNSQVSGTTAVAATGEVEGFFASFTVAGVALQTPPLVQNGAIFFLDSGLTKTLFSLDLGATTVFSWLAEVFGGDQAFQIQDPNGDWEVFKNGTIFTVYLNGILVATLTSLASDFAGSFTINTFSQPGASISNVILGL
jgi:hypothetical protein